MRTIAILILALLSCQPNPVVVDTIPAHGSDRALKITPVSYPEATWQGFLQRLPTADKPIVDYTGRPISGQAKHASIITYDVGSEDLQQCADALMRIRAEYLFSKQRYEAIGFHFTAGGYYAFRQYLKGIRPVARAKGLAFVSTAHACTETHQALRRYLDIVYAYANTVTLCKELQPTGRFDVGTVIIFPGSPGHCCMITEKAVTPAKDTVYKLVEGYMPAQSIYVLANPYEPQISPWYHLHEGRILTASCDFRSYYLRRFE